MLRDEHRMSAKRRLLPIVRRSCRRQPLRYESGSMLQHNRPTFRREIIAFRWPEHEALAKPRSRKRREELIEIAHSQ